MKRMQKELIQLRKEQDDNYQEELASDGVCGWGGFCIWVRNLIEDFCYSLNQSFPM